MRLSLYLLISFLSFTISAKSHANDLLSEIDAYLNSQPLYIEFNSPAVFVRNEVSCIGTTNICDTQKRISKNLSATDSEVILQSLRTNGDVYRNDTLTAAHWKALNGNWVRFQIKAVENFGFKLLSIQTSKEEYIVQVNNAPKKLEAMFVVLKFKNAINQNVQKDIAITNELLGLGKIVYLKETNSSGVTTTTLTSAQY